jgi:hypothetical protein
MGLVSFGKLNGYRLPRMNRKWRCKTDTAPQKRSKMLGVGSYATNY